MTAWAGGWFMASPFCSGSLGEQDGYGRQLQNPRGHGPKQCCAQSPSTMRPETDQFATKVRGQFDDRLGRMTDMYVKDYIQGGPR